MKKVIAARFSDQTTFDKMGRNGQTYLTIKRVVDEANDIPIGMSLYVVDGKSKSIIPSTNLIGETLQILDTPFCIQVVSADSFTLGDIADVLEGALPPKNSLRQLRKVANSTKGVSKAGKTKYQGDLLDKEIETETKTIYDWYHFNEDASDKVVDTYITMEEDEDEYPEPILNIKTEGGKHYTMNIRRFDEYEDLEEGLVPENSLKQLNDVRKVSKSTDIGEKTRLKGPNMVYDRSALDTKVETYKDYTKTQKDFLKSKSGYYHISKPSKL